MSRIEESGVPGPPTASDGTWPAPALPARRPATRVTFERVIANAVTPAAAIISGPLLARGLGVNGRGELAAILAPILLASILVGAASGDVMAADVASGRLSIRQAFLPGVTAAVIYSVVIISLLVWISPTLMRDYPAGVAIQRLLSLSLLLTAVQLAIRYLRQGEHRFGRLTREAWTGALLRLAALAVLLLIGRLSVATAAVTTVGAAFVPVVLLGIHVPVRWSGTARQFWSASRLQFTKSTKALLGNVASQLNLRLDQAVLAALVGTVPLGLYAVAVSAAELPVIAIAAIRQVVLTEAAARRDSELVARATRTTVLILIPIVILGSLLAPAALGHVYGVGFRAGAPMMTILLVATLAGAPGSLLTTGMVAAGRPGLAGIPAFVGLLVTGALLIPLINADGAEGAAWTSLASYGTTSLVAVYMFHRTTGISFRACLVPQISDVVRLARGIRARGHKAAAPAPTEETPLSDEPRDQP